MQRLKQNFCRVCGLKDPEDIENLKTGGWCWTCYISRNEHSSIKRRLQESAQIELHNLKQIDYSSPFKSYEIEKKLHTGAKSTVYKVKCTQTKEYFALKQIFDKNQFFEQATKEYLFAYDVNSKRLVKSFKAFRDGSNFYILSELMEMTLEDFINKFKPLSEKLIVHIIREIVKGLLVIHKNNRIHRDLKPGNIFISKEGEVKIGDFGEIGESYEDRPLNQSIFGTPLYMAPEVLQNKEYTYLVDIWSLGIVLLELTGSKFYDKRVLGELVDCIINEEPPWVNTSYSAKIKNLSKNCLQKNCNERISTTQIKNLRIIKKGKDKSHCIKKMINSYI